MQIGNGNVDMKWNVELSVSLLVCPCQYIINRTIEVNRPINDNNYYILLINREVVSEKHIFIHQIIISIVV